MQKQNIINCPKTNVFLIHFENLLILLGGNEGAQDIIEFSKNVRLIHFVKTGPGFRGKQETPLKSQNQSVSFILWISAPLRGFQIDFSFQ